MEKYIIALFSYISDFMEVTEEKILTKIDDFIRLRAA